MSLGKLLSLGNVYETNVHRLKIDGHCMNVSIMCFKDDVKNTFC